MWFKRLAPLAVVLTLGTFALAETKACCDTAAAKDTYPLKTCVVSGDELGEMGDATIIQYEGREVRLCCADCEKPFRKDPQKYLKKLDEAAEETQPSTQPSDAE